MNNTRESDIKVSVILPVWNPGSGIINCIESLQKQTLEEIEIIFVDDCGTDDSMDKVSDAAEEDPRIRILKNKENIGPGPSRNKGIGAARGKYLSFVDPDDYVGFDFLELLYKEAERKNCDIVRGSMALVRCDGTVRYTQGSQAVRKKLSKGVPLYAAFTRGHQTAIYKKSVLTNKNISYGSTRRFEDVVFLLKVCSLANEFSTVDEARYYYCQRQDSSMHTTTTIMLQNYLDGVHELTDYSTVFLPKNNYTRAYLQDLFHSAIRELSRYIGMPGSERWLPVYVDRLRTESMREPYRNHLMQGSFPIYALNKYHCLLPLKPFFHTWEESDPPVRYARLVKQWADFYLSTPEAAEACRKDLIKIIYSANKAAEKKPTPTYNSEERKLGKEMLMQQLKRLPLELWYQAEYLSYSENRTH